MEFTDEYSHDMPGVMYFPQSLLTEEVQESYNYSLEGCNCKVKCSSDSGCSCIERTGTFYKFNDIRDVKNYTICETSDKKPTYECNESCSCRDVICGNRLVQYGPRGNLTVKSCENDKGLGLFTIEDIKFGNFVCEYAGEIITEVLAFQRYKNNAEQNNMNYIYCIKEHFGEKIVKTYIDPTYYGNIGRYINHSCEPNCILHVIRVDDPMPILGIFANKDIRKNSEITYNYGGDSNSGSHENYTHTQKQCLCDSEKCKKYLPLDMNLSPSFV